jgi:hypothetical protein
MALTITSAKKLDAGPVRCCCGRVYPTALAALLCSQYDHQVLGAGDLPDAEFAPEELALGKLRPADWPGPSDAVEISEYVHPDRHARELCRSYDDGFIAGYKRRDLRLLAWGALAGAFSAGTFIAIAWEVGRWLAR